MSKQDLERIQEHINQGKKHIKQAKQYADKVGDKDGSKRLEKHVKELEETHYEFWRKGR